MFFLYLARVICTWQDKIDKFVHIIYVFNYFDKMIYRNCKEIFIIRNNRQSNFLYLMIITKTLQQTCDILLQFDNN